jgi:hypothetical protein
MNVNEAFPSKYIKASDIGDKAVTVTIEKITVEDVVQGQKKEEKIVLHFRGKDKGLVCNKTNASTIAKLYGDETEDWIGQRITLVSREVEFQGESVMAIRVSLKKPASAEATATAKPVPRKPDPDPEPSDIDEDSVPF